MLRGHKSGLRSKPQRGSWEVYGLLGPNGSGKSTLMKMMLGLLKPDDVFITVGGFDVQRNPIDARRRIVGYVR